MSQSLTKDLLDFLKDQFNLRTWDKIRDANKVQDRYRNILLENARAERKKVENFIKTMEEWRLEKYKEVSFSSNLFRGQKLLDARDVLKNARDFRTETVAEVEKLEKLLQENFEKQVAPKCPVTGSKIDEVTSNFFSYTHDGLDSIEDLVKDCVKNMNGNYKMMREKYGTLYETTKSAFDKKKVDYENTKKNPGSV